MKKIYSFLLVLVITFPSIGTAQPTHNWTRLMQDGSSVSAYPWIANATMDANNNVFTFGYCKSLVSMDSLTGPGPLVLPFPSISNFLIKSDSLGQALWYKVFKRGNFKDICTDLAGNLYGSGFINNEDTLDIDQTTSVDNIPPPSGSLSGSMNIVLFKFDPAGNLSWVKRLAGHYINIECHIEVSDLGDIYLTGSVYDTVDIDPGPGTYIVAPEAPQSNVFLAKFNTSGIFQWGNTISNSSFFISALGIDKDQNICLATDYVDSTDFKTGPGVVSLPVYSPSVPIGNAIVKYNPAGSLLSVKPLYWQKEYGNSFIMDMGFDNDNNLMLNCMTAGASNDTLFFAPGSPIEKAAQKGDRDFFVVKFDTSGQQLWCNYFGSPSTVLDCRVTFDPNGNYYTTGFSYTAPIDIDPSVAIVNIASTGYIAYYNRNGQYIASYTEPGFNSNFRIINNAGSDLFYLYGYTEGSIHGGDGFDLDLGPDTLMLEPANPVAFFSQYNPGACYGLALVIDSLSSVLCADNGMGIGHAEGGVEPYQYSWNTTPMTNDSAVVFENGGIYQFSVTDSTGCTRSRALFINEPVYPGNFDLGVNLIHNHLFITGQPSGLTLDGYNLGCTPVSGTLNLVLDSLLDYTSASPTPDLISGDTLTWNFTNITYDSDHIKPTVFFHVSTSANLGDHITLKAFIQSASMDADTSNNIKTTVDPVVTSYDPNLISVYPAGSCDEGFILNTQKLTYTIHFQNTGTFMAFNIAVLSALDPNLNISTLNVLSSSHNMVTEIMPGNVVKFIFNDIMLVDSTSNEPESHGYLIYEINPLVSLLPMATIEASADIYFDFNEPITTNTVSNTVVSVIPNCFLSIAEDMTAHGNIQVYPNPSAAVFNLAFSGTVTGGLTVFDHTGRQVLSEKINAASNASIDLGDFAQGIYLVSLKVNGSYHTVKVVKQ